MTGRGRAGTRGITLLETTISLAVLSVLGAGIFSLMIDAQGTFSTSLRSNRLRQDSLSSLQQLERDLASANPDTLAVDTTDPRGDRLTVQGPIALNAGVVTWGAQGNAGFQYQYLVAQDAGSGALQLVRRLLDDQGVAAAADEVLAGNVDAPGAGGKGFVVQQTGNVVDVSLKLRLSDAGGDIVREQSAKIRLHTQ